MLDEVSVLPPGFLYLFKLWNLWCSDFARVYERPASGWTCQSLVILQHVKQLLLFQAIYNNVLSRGSKFTWNLWISLDKDVLNVSFVSQQP